MSEPAIEAKDLHFSYGDVHAVQGIGFEVQPGEILGFLGPNGAGKSTTIKILTGLLTPRSGTVRILGLDGIRDRSAIQARIGVCFEEKNLYADMTATENLAFHAKDVDLLVHEALSPKLVGVMNESAKKLGLKRLEKITFDIPDYHATPVEAAEVAEAAGAAHLLYYHVVPPLIVPGASAVFLEGTADAFSGDITLGVNGTMVSLPRDSDAIEVSKR